MKQSYYVDSESEAKRLAMRIANAPFKRPYTVTADFSDDRTAEQNRLMWPLLRDMSKQVEWFNITDGRLRMHKEEEWKDFFMAMLKGQSMMASPDGGMILTGGSSKKLSKKAFSDLIEIIYAFGSERHVSWCTDSQKILMEHKRGNQDQSSGSGVQ